jgi:hypothetical protein
VAGQDGLVDQILGEHRLAEAVRGDDDDVLALGEEVEGQDAFDRGPMDVRGPLPFEIGHGLVAPEARILEAPFHARLQARGELRVGQPFELHDRAPAFLRGARDEVIELAGGMGEPELPQLVTQRRRDRVE